MARLEALLLCDLHVFGPDGKVQLQGIFDRIFVQSFPASHRSAWLYFRFFVETASKAPYMLVSFSISRPNGITEKLGEFKAPIGYGGKVEGSLALKNFPLYGEGDHSIDLYTSGEKVGSYKFWVHVVKSSPAGGQQKNE